MRIRKVKTVTVAIGKQPAMFFGQRPLHDRAGHMDDMPSRQIPSVGEDGLRSARIASQTIHDIRTFSAQLDTRKRVNRIVNAMMVGTETPKHRIIRRVDNRVGAQTSDITPPKDDIRLICTIRPQTTHIHNTGAVMRALTFATQIRVLHGKEPIRRRHRRTNIHQRTQQITPIRIIIRERKTAAIRQFSEQHADKPFKPRRLRKRLHGTSPIFNVH